MNKIKFLKFIDRVLGKSLVYLLPRIKKNRNDISQKIKKILIIRPGGIGDAVLLMPAINLLKLRFPDSEFDILCEKRNADIFRLSKDINPTPQLLSCESKKRGYGVNSIYLYDKGLGFIRCLRNRYDVVIDTEQWHRLSAVVSYLTGAPIRIGFDTNERGKLFTHRIPYSHDDYEVYSFFHQIEPLMHDLPEVKIDEPFIDIPDGSSSKLLSGAMEENNRLIAVFPGASVMERRWGGDRFGKVAKALNDKGYKIVILGLSSDMEDADSIKRYAHDCIDLTGRTNLRDVSLILKMSRVLLTADSGLMHIASAVGTPTVSLFGAGIEKKWAPKGKQHIILNKHLACSPCTRFGYTPPCKIDVECLSSISVDEVTEAVENILNQD